MCEKTSRLLETIVLRQLFHKNLKLKLHIFEQISAYPGEGNLYLKSITQCAK